LKKNSEFRMYQDYCPKNKGGMTRVLLADHQKFTIVLIFWQSGVSR